MPQLPSAEYLELQQAVAGRYSLDREIGRGGMGIVFLARDVALDRPVAIKLFPPDLARNTSLRDRFLREARTAAKLSHPNIVPIHSVEEHGTLVFFVMTYVEGETLTQRIASGGPLPVRDAVRVMREVAWALVQAHAQGVIHRDIKADNILLEQGSGRALVSDFGIATVGDAAASDDSGLMGTPEFMSPEQAKGETVDARTDLYSLGVVAFLAMAGRFPFDASSPSEWLAHHIRTEPPSLHTVAPGVPTRLSALIEQCLVKEAGERVVSAQVLADALGNTLEARREMPVAVRIFVQDIRQRQQRSTGLVYTLFGLWGSALLVPLWLTGGAAGYLVIPGLAALVGGPVALMIRRIRRVLKAGYAQHDVVQAFAQDVDARREELAFLYGADYARTARSLRRVAYVSLGATGALVIAAVTVPALANGAFVGALITGVLGAATGLPADRRSERKAKGRWKFWKGRMARWLFRMAGIGIAPQPQAVALTHRPTEFSVGLAVTSLYQSLPKASREALTDLPAVVEELEADAQRMRRKVEEYDRLLVHAGSTMEHPMLETEQSMAGDRYRAERRLRGVRAEAQRRLQAAVAALETLRVDLLRMRSGTENLKSITTNLGNARELAADVGRLLEGQEEVERMLGS